MLYCMRKRRAWSLLALVLLYPGQTCAIPITFTVTVDPLVGGVYRYTYTVSNDGSLGVEVAVELFDILFPTNLYEESSLAFVTPSALTTDWSELILVSAPGVPAAYDVSTLTGGIVGGASVTGFAVESRWLGGPRGPGAQAFEVFDPHTFALLQSGTTIPAQATVIPEPGTLVLLGSGIVGLLWWRRRVHNTPA